MERTPPISALAREIEAPKTSSVIRRLNLAAKRVLDVVGASLALALLSPLLIVAAIAIKLEDGGPVLFIQERWGKDNKVFKVFKFRSMQTGKCDASGVTQTVEGDDRVTRVGAFFRKTNIDELPQLLNVIKGDMSIVGPRCHVPDMKAAGMVYEDLVPKYHLRHAMRPGITGLAQVRGLRGPTVSASLSIRRVQADLEYVANFNVMLDIVIILRTIWKEVLRGGSGF